MMMKSVKAYVPEFRLECMQQKLVAVPWMTPDLPGAGERVCFVPQ